MIQLELTIEVLNIELTDVSKQIEKDLEKYEEETTELEAQICHLQEKSQTEVISLTTASSQKHEFTTNVRALYYYLYVYLLERLSQWWRMLSVT